MSITNEDYQRIMVLFNEFINSTSSIHIMIDDVAREQSGIKDDREFILHEFGAFLDSNG